jgi:hypothetical protein
MAAMAKNFEWSVPNHVNHAFGLETYSAYSLTYAKTLCRESFTGLSPEETMTSSHTRDVLALHRAALEVVMLPRTFTDAHRVTHRQWATGGRFGVVLACGKIRETFEHWDNVQKPVSCFACLARGPR